MKVCSYDLYSYFLYNYGIYSYGLYSYGIYIAMASNVQGTLEVTRVELEKANQQISDLTGAVSTN